VLCGPCAADDLAYQQWLDFKHDFAEQASGQTGMYAIQDMRELKPGQTVWLAPAEDLEAMRWSVESHDAAIATVEYKDGGADVTGPGIETADLLELQDRKLMLPNGLTVRASFLGKDALKLWLYNPKLVAKSNFKGLDYFPYDSKGIVPASFHRNDDPSHLNYLDSRDHAGVMYVVGNLEMQIDGKPYDLKAFSYKNTWSDIDAVMLFVKDRTSGKTTYGGGRVVEVAFPKGAPPETMTVNFNMAYSFLCAHSEFYNCPLILTSPIDAELAYGEKYPPQ
jgi:uncharacterized protein (DUF1684 family)